MLEETTRPSVRLLSEALAGQILDEAFEILEKVGVFVENAEAHRLLLEHGAVLPPDASLTQPIGRLRFPRRMVEEACQKAPRSITLWDSSGQDEVKLEGDRVHFDPGSAALYLHDPQAGRIRKPVSADLLRYIRLVNGLPHYHLQSTALISSDVPESCGDSYRLYLALKHGRKPVVTGTFKKESFGFMQEMLTLIRGGNAALAAKPLAIFDACPSQPLIWSDLTAHSVIQAARAGIPSEFVSMPLTGSTAPITLSGAVTQHAAETLSGVLLAQCAAPGAPVIWGGSPAAMDLRFGTTPMGSIETMMIDVAYAQVGKRLGLPTHAYMGLSDAKQVDYQAGFESGIGLILAALAGINVVSGVGMMDFESCQSLEKLVLDHEVCGMAYRLIEGIAQRDKPMALDLLAAFPLGGHLLTDPHTLKWFRQEIFSPGKTIDRRARGTEDLSAIPTAALRAEAEVERLLSAELDSSLTDQKSQALDRLMIRELQKNGVNQLPAFLP
ncbi:MAG: trimethylamine methyltransferase family protein [bacterium]